MTQEYSNSQLPVVGIGTDVHPFEPINDLYLAGLHWPGEQGLAGHSDGDVVAHACCDALFSAAGLGDLGSQFGTLRPQIGRGLWDRIAQRSCAPSTRRGIRDWEHRGATWGNKPKLGTRREEAQAALSQGWARA